MEQLQKVSAAFVFSTNKAAPGGLKDVNSRTVVLQLDFFLCHSAPAGKARR